MCTNAWNYQHKYYIRVIIELLNTEIMKLMTHPGETKSLGGWVELQSVGCHVDLVEKLVYPTLKNGMPDMECPTPFVKDEMPREWWDSLDWEDRDFLQTYNPLHYLS